MTIIDWLRKDGAGQPAVCLKAFAVESIVHCRAVHILGQGASGGLLANAENFLNVESLL